MNNVYISGIIATEPQFTMEGIEGPGVPHLHFILSVKKVTKSGPMFETYRCSAWYTSAQYWAERLRAGMQIAINGQLCQRDVRISGQEFKTVEISFADAYPYRKSPDGQKDAPVGDEDASGRETP